MPAVSIIIRTKNEERWLGRCLTMLRMQSYQDFEIVIVDNQSQDATVAVAQRFGVKKIITITEYRPGLALNRGIQAAEGEYIVCLSAHCLPKNERWLANLLAGFANADIAGVYGRQIPVTFTPDTDKRDLLITFGRDRRIQVKDYFFHNANSAIRRRLWERWPFDESVPNIEDRIWAKAIIEQGYKLLYEPEAIVYHHHGIHQNNRPERARGTVSVIEDVENDEDVNDLPAILKPEACRVLAILPVQGDVQRVGNHNLLATAFQSIQQARYITDIALLTDVADVGFTPPINTVHLPRAAHLNTPDVTIEEVLRYGLGAAEAQGVFPDIILYINYLYPFRPVGILDQVIIDLQLKGLDTVFPACMDYQNYWVETATGSFTQIGDGLKARSSKEPLYRALYGVACATTTATLRLGQLLGERIGIVPLDDQVYSLKYQPGVSEEIIEAVLARQPATLPQSIMAGSVAALALQVGVER